MFICALVFPVIIVREIIFFTAQAYIYNNIARSNGNKFDQQIKKQQLPTIIANFSSWPEQMLCVRPNNATRVQPRVQYGIRIDTLKAKRFESQPTIIPALSLPVYFAPLLADFLLFKNLRVYQTRGRRTGNYITKNAEQVIIKNLIEAQDICLRFPLAT